MEKDSVMDWIYKIISDYGLSLVSRDGYKFYGCEGSGGLGKYNREPFNKLSDDFNQCKVIDYRYYVMLYVIIVYAFNNQIRFNSEGKFNLPVGKRDFNASMQKKLSAFINRVQSVNCRFICQDFRNLNVEKFIEDDFVYCDPPYLITCAVYNENGGWLESDEQDLLNFLDKLNTAGIKFALSNVLRSKGRENKILSDWLEKNSAIYNAVHLKKSYANSNYHKADKISESDEVLILNYKI